MEEILSPAVVELVNRVWEATLKQVCGAAPGDSLGVGQINKLTEFVLGQMWEKTIYHLPPGTSSKPITSHPLFPGVNVPTKRRSFRATSQNPNMWPPTEGPVGKKRNTCDSDTENQRVQSEESMETGLLLPGNFMDAMMAMGAHEEDKIKFLVQKKLTRTDVGKAQNRLQIPVKKIMEGEFLTAEEKKLVDSPEGLVVQVLEPSCGEVCELRLRLWRMNKNQYYALVNNHNHGSDDSPNKWHGLVTRNRIFEHQKVQLWSFRVGLELKLCLAIVKI